MKLTSLQKNALERVNKGTHNEFPCVQKRIIRDLIKKGLIKIDNKKLRVA